MSEPKAKKTQWAVERATFWGGWARVAIYSTEAKANAVVRRNTKPHRVVRVEESSDE